MLILRLALVVAIFVAANVLTLAAPSSLAATRLGGEAYGLAVGSPATGVPGAAYVQLPADGGNVADTSPGAGYGVGNAVGSTAKITTSSVGDLGGGNVTSTTTVADGELLGGVVRAHDIRIVATVSGVAHRHRSPLARSWWQGSPSTTRSRIRASMFPAWVP